MYFTICEDQKLLGISSRNVVFVPEEPFRASSKRHAFGPYQSNNTFLGLRESVYMRSMEHTLTDQEFYVCNFRCNLVSDFNVDFTLHCGG